jgi:hypothetical protein
MPEGKQFEGQISEWDPTKALQAIKSVQPSFDNPVSPWWTLGTIEIQTFVDWYNGAQS